MLDLMNAAVFLEQQLRQRESRMNPAPPSPGLDARLRSSKTLALIILTPRFPVFATR